MIEVRGRPAQQIHQMSHHLGRAEGPTPKRDIVAEFSLRRPQYRRERLSPSDFSALSNSLRQELNMGRIRGGSVGEHRRDLHGDPRRNGGARTSQSVFYCTLGNNALGQSPPCMTDEMPRCECKGFCRLYRTWI